MALNLASGLQVSAHFFWNRRNAAALSHHGVRMEFDPVQRQRASLILGFIFALLAVALMFVLSWFKPAGQVGKSAILADRDTGAVYVLVDGRLHPALNLATREVPPVGGAASNSRRICRRCCRAAIVVSRRCWSRCTRTRVRSGR